jgi:Fic family protein
VVAGEGRVGGDILDLLAIIVGDDKSAGPGAYRTTGVIIAGAEHRPPKSLAIPGLMEELFGWINAHSDSNPVLLAALAHHEVTAIHPFLDGNGLTARLLMNLIPMRAGLPVSNIRRHQPIPHR